MSTETTPVRQYILEAAKPIILGKGFAATGLNEILAAAEVPKGSFYHYFKSKEAFGEALLDHYFDHYLGRLSVLLSDTTRPGAERLMAYWGKWLDEQSSDRRDNHCLVVKLGGEVSDLSEAMRVALQRGTDQIIERLSDCVRAGCADGSLPTHLDARQTARSLYEMWLGATLLAKIQRHRSPLESAMDTTRQLLQQPA